MTQIFHFIDTKGTIGPFKKDINDPEIVVGPDPHGLDGIPKFYSISRCHIKDEVKFM